MHIGVVDVYLALQTEKKFQGVGYYVQSIKHAGKCVLEVHTFHYGVCFTSRNPFSLIMIKIVMMELNYKVKQVCVSIKLYLINIW